MVFCGIYPADGAQYGDLRDALDKLKLNDASLSYEQETSSALGYGFRCGFLGLLHMEIIQERLEREFDLDLVTTAPSVIYRVKLTSGEVIMIDNPSNLPPVTEIEQLEEPVVNATIMTPSEYVGSIMEICQERRGVFIDMNYIEESRVRIHYVLPLNEIIYDFFDQLKSRSRGYASFDYELKGYEKSDLVKLDFLLNGDMCDALSTIVHATATTQKGARYGKLCEVIRASIEIRSGARIGGKIIRRETVRAVRKDVLASATAAISRVRRSAGKTEGRQEAHAPDRHRFSAERRVHERAAHQLTMAGIYLHIPFCVRKCAYCDFVSFPRGSVPESYVDALLTEIELVSRGGEYPAAFDTVFFGGGTPSLLSGDQMRRMMKALSERFNIRAQAECSMEANPGTATPEKLEAYRNAGINRLSIGLQSTHDALLDEIGRIHTFQQFLDTLHSAKAAGFDNINVDLMHALPHQTISQYLDSIRTVCDLNVQHISAYSLILEEHTPLYFRVQSGEASMPDEDLVADMQDAGIDALESYGYHRYEISNFAQSGFECRHNLNYWQNGDIWDLALRRTPPCGKNTGRALPTSTA
jgi:putative oxygen-independent coproporphyrinogen III oxidase